MVADYLIFVRELPRSFGEIGAMLPSSPALAELMVASIKRADHPLTILEVGPGTGPFTRKIVGLMGARDRLVICEINPRFLRRLRQTLLRNPDYLRNRDRIVFFEGAVQQLPCSHLPTHYDIIVSSLPFVNFSPEVVDEIFRLFHEMTRDGGSLTFLQYVGMGKIRELLSKKPTRTRVREVDRVVEKWCCEAARRGNLQQRVSLFNVPPAKAIELSFQT
jgi:phosphatidylethanolamine/phosphatidyl-N-methylethanolamine N-methyltransferase